jgi:hypothetical protein
MNFKKLLFNLLSCPLPQHFGEWKIAKERSVKMKIFFTCQVHILFAELILQLYLKYNTSIIVYLLLQQCTSGGHKSGL